MTLTKNVNGQDIPLTPNEIDEYNNRKSEWNNKANERLIKECTFALELAIETKANEKSYQSTLSCTSYAQSTNPQWAAEAQAFIAWRDDCWVYATNYLAQVQNGEIQNPTKENFLSGIPVLNWP